ncbi:MAG: hypothetical protein JW878_08950 [Methanomicrobia archaeon]|nr:hypothetical protein [Methanomicrobia archaeon]
MNSKKKEIETIWKEYELLDRNYAYRDRLVPYEFYIALGILGVLIGLKGLWENDRASVILVFLIGVLALYVLHLDMMSNVSCKGAVKERMREIERDIGNYNEGEIVICSLPDLQNVLDRRKKFWLEEKLKFMSAGKHMIWFIRLLLLGWIVYFIEIWCNNPVLSLFILVRNIR